MINDGRRPALLTDDGIVLDTDAMRVAVLALSRIPTAHRRSIALDWLVARVQADIVRLRDVEDATSDDRAAQRSTDRSSSCGHPGAPGTASEVVS